VKYEKPKRNLVLYRPKRRTNALRIHPRRGQWMTGHLAIDQIKEVLRVVVKLQKSAAKCD
jgi:hypothetical protein